MRRQTVIPLAVIVSIALTTPAPASATTRSDFTAQSEALCKTTNVAQSKRADRLISKYKRLRPRGRFSQFTRAQRLRDDALYFGGYGRFLIFQGQSIHRLDRQLQLVPEPAGDEPSIAQWIESRRVDADLLKQAGQQLRRVSRHKPQRTLGVVFGFDGIYDQLGLTDLILGSFSLDQCLLAPEQI